MVPIFKKGKKSDPANYRSVSLTFIVGKVMEKIVRTHVIHHLEQNKLMCDEQHGFMGGRFCSTQLLEVCDEWTNEIYNGHNVDCIYLDYGKLLIVYLTYVSNAKSSHMELMVPYLPG